MAHISGMDRLRLLVVHIDRFQPLIWAAFIATQAWQIFVIQHPASLSAPGLPALIGAIVLGLGIVARATLLDQFWFGLITVVILVIQAIVIEVDPLASSLLSRVPTLAVVIVLAMAVYRLYLKGDNREPNH